jgi:hypothetical protein
MSCFLFSLFSFFSYEIGELEGRTSLAQRWGLAPVGGGRCWEKGVGGWIWYNETCTHVSKCKNVTCWNYSRNQGREGWRKVEGVNSCMIYLIHLITLVNATMYPHPSQQYREIGILELFWKGDLNFSEFIFGFYFISYLFIYFYCCSGWGGIVAFTKFLKMYQIYHTLIQPLHHSPLSSFSPILGIVSAGIIFAFISMYTQYLGC